MKELKVKTEERSKSLFENELLRSIKQYLGKSAKINICTVSKVNKPPVTAITIRAEKDNAAPAIYLDQYYEQYKNGVSINDIVMEILNYRNDIQQNINFDTENFLAYNTAKKHIVCRLINTSRNAHLLREIPHKEFLDLSIIYAYTADDPIMGNMSITIRNSHLYFWGITTDQLHNIAIKNTRKLMPCRISTINQMLSNMIDMQVENSCESNYPMMYVVTNDDMAYGSINLIYSDTLDVISQKLGDIIIIPSSIHEILILPKSDWKGYEPINLKEIVESVNRDFVSEEEFLSNSIYFYSSQLHKLQFLA